MNNELKQEGMQAKIENSMQNLSYNIQDLGNILEDILSILVGSADNTCECAIEPLPLTLEERLYSLHCKVDGQRVVAEDIREILRNQLGNIKLADRNAIQHCESKGPCDCMVGR